MHYVYDLISMLNYETFNVGLYFIKCAGGGAGGGGVVGK